MNKESFIDDPDNFFLIHGNQQANCNKNCFPKDVNAKSNCKVECFFPLNDQKDEEKNIKLTGITTVIKKCFDNKILPSKPYFIIGFGPPASGKSGIVPFLARNDSILNLNFDIKKENTVDINVDFVFQTTQQWKDEKVELKKKSI